MKILLISPWDKRRWRYRSPLSFMISYPPLALPMLAALAPAELNPEITVYDEISDRKPPPGPFDVVAITVLTSESVRAYELADYYRGLGAFVVLGGYHVTFLPQEALEHADAVVTGEGIAAWPKLLRDIAAGTVTDRIYNDKGAPPPESRPVPRRSILKSRAYAPIDTIIASSGCPNDCNFCSIKMMAPHSCRPVDEVIAELRGLKRSNVIFYDPNFFASRENALKLMKAMEPLRLRWGATATADFGLDEELMTAAQKSGCNGVLIGFESLNAAALEGANKDFGDAGSYKQIIENIHRHRMSINGTFVVGLDNDTEDDLLALPDAVSELGIDLPLFFLLTPMPGNALHAEMKEQGRILTYDWSRYSHADIVFQPKNMTPERLMELYLRTWKKAYSFRSIIKRAFRSPGTSFQHRIVVLFMNIGFKFLGRDRGEI